MKKCKVCQRPLFDTALIEFHDMPAIAQNFPKKENLDSDSAVSFDVKQCSGCGLIQLTSDPVTYYRDVIRSAAYSPEMLQFRREQFSDFLNEFNLEGRRIIEIGCGRGEYLSLMQEAGARAYGLEHCNSSVDQCKKNGLNVENGFIESEGYVIPNGPFDGFFIMNFLEHIPNINSFLFGIANNLVSEGIGLIEVPNFDMVIRERLVSEFMTDHLFYFTKDTLRTALCLNGFEVISCKEIWHDYILSAVVKKKTPLLLEAFNKQRERIQNSLDGFIARLQGGSLVIWGAGHQALAAISLYKLKERVAYVVDSAPFKQGRYTPASHLPIRSPEDLRSDTSIEAVIVMGAAYSDEIISSLEKSYSSDLLLAVIRTEGLEVIR